MLPNAPNIILYIDFMPVAVLSTYGKIDFFWEMMFESRHLVVLSSCYPSFFDGHFRHWRWMLYVVVNENALAESIVTQLIHVFEWLAESIEALVKEWFTI